MEWEGATTPPGPKGKVGKDPSHRGIHPRPQPPRHNQEEEPVGQWKQRLARGGPHSEKEQDAPDLPETWADPLNTAKAKAPDTRRPDGDQQVSVGTHEQLSRLSPSLP